MAGVYAIKAVVTDNDDSAKTSTIATVTVRNKTPYIALKTPLNKATYAIDDSIIITAAVKDTDGTIQKIEFYANDSLLGTDSSAQTQSTDTAVLVWHSVVAGTYAIKAVVTDNDDSTKTSTIATVTVRNKIPYIALKTPLNKAVYAIGDSIIITAAVKDTDGTIQKIEFYSNDSLLGTDSSAQTQSTDTAVLVWHNVVAGICSIKAVVTDNDDSAKTSTIAVVTVRNKIPSISLKTPLNNATYAIDDSIIITAAVKDTDGTIQKVEFYANDSLLGTDSSAQTQSTDTAVLVWHNVIGGTYAIKAVVTDNDDSAKTSTVATVTVRNKIPTVSLKTPLANATYGIDDSIIISAAAKDTDGTIQKVEFYVNDSLLGTDSSAQTQSADTAVLVWHNVVVGSYVFKAVVTDNDDSAKTSATVSVTVRNKLPYVKIATPTNNQVFVLGDSIEVTVTANDSDGSITCVQIYRDTVLLKTDSSSPYSYTFSNAQPDTYNLTAVAWDNDDSSKTSAQVKATLRNKLPVVTLISPTVGSSYKTSDSIPLSATATDSDGVITCVQFYWDTTLIATDSSSPYEFTWKDSIPYGTHAIKAIAWDTSDGSKTASINLTIANDPPPTAVAVSAPSNIQADGMTLDWSQNSEADFESYRIYYGTSADIDTSNTLAATITNKYVTSYVLSGLTGSTTYFIKIFVFDEATQFTGSNEVNGSTP